jgi:hypothetical protein
MLITIAALYVILPAIFALGCVAAAMLLQFTPVAEEEAIMASSVYTVVRDECARKAVHAVHMARAQSSAAARQVWLDVAGVYRRRAEAYHAASTA